MPIYQFKCEACDHECEELMKMGASKKKCPECGEPKLKKQITLPIHHDTMSPMHPRRGRGHGGYGRVDPGEGMKDFGRNF